jgi:hypothetical protein
VAAYPHAPTVIERETPVSAGTGLKLTNNGGYNTLRHGTAYTDPGASYHEKRYRQRVLATLRRRAKSLGYVLQTTDPTPPVAAVS